MGGVFESEHRSQWPSTEEDQSPPTHRVAVAAYIFRGGRLLLLKRTKPPFTYCPPGGRLLPGENPAAGLRREVKEETGLEIEIVGVAHTWFGSVVPGKPRLLCINYLARSPSGDVRMNHEHTDCGWFDRRQIESGALTTLDENGNGYRPEEILCAFDLFDRLRPDRQS